MPKVKSNKRNIDYIIKSVKEECELGNLENIKFLVKHGENVKDYPEYMDAAIRSGNEQLVYFLTEQSNH